jgi:hypothetical protein
MDFLPLIEGSEQRPHQKTQSAQYKTPSRKIPKELGDLAFALETWDKLKMKKERE